MRNATQREEQTVRPLLAVACAALHPPTQTWNQLDLHDSLDPAEVDFDSMSLTLRDTFNTIDCIVLPCDRLD